MDHLSTGAGLGALGFWIFVAAIVAAGVWNSIRKRDAQHETLRRIIESGQNIDEVLTDKLLDLTSGSQDLPRDTRAAGLMMLCVAPGIAVLGAGMYFVAGTDILWILLAIGAMLACMGFGFMAAARVMERPADSDDPSSAH